MQLWIVLFASAVLFGLICLASAIRIELQGRGRGEASGAWVFAGGVACGPLTVAAVGRAGLPLHLDVRVFGRRVPSFGRGRAGARPPSPPSDQVGAAAAKARKRRRPALRPLEIAELAAGEWKRLKVERLIFEVDYGFQDIVLTGKLAGALYAIGGVLPPPVCIRQRPRFDGGERWEVVVEGALRVAPGLVLLDLVCYMFERWRSRPRPLGPSATAPHVENPS